MSSYTAFASVYDIMQYDVNYTFWANKLVDKINEYHHTARRGLELACGTGTLAIELSKMGYVMEGLDISDEMLAIAQQKANEAHQKLRFLCQDMAAFQTKKNYDFIFSMCDGINYLVEDEAILGTFESVASHLSESGVFIFDVSSYFKLSEVIGNQTFAETFEDAAYIWENQFDEDENLLEFVLTLFSKSNKGYERHEEFHTQRAFKTEEIKQFLKEHFEILEVLDGDTFEQTNSKSERICFICRKK